MGYPIFGKVKTIVLPFRDSDWLLNQSGITFEAFTALYKEKYGIDLSEIFKITYIEGNKIRVELPKNTLILLECHYGILTPIGSKMRSYNYLIPVPAGESSNALVVFDTSSVDGSEDGLSVSLRAYSDSIKIQIEGY